MLFRSAKIFDGKITKWNDPAIADQNKDLTLPDTAISLRIYRRSRVMTASGRAGAPLSGLL